MRVTVDNLSKTIVDTYPAHKTKLTTNYQNCTVNTEIEIGNTIEDQRKKEKPTGNIYIYIYIEKERKIFAFFCLMGRWILL